MHQCGLNTVSHSFSMIRFRDQNGSTPLHFASTNFEARPEVITMLLDHGADINAKDQVREYEFMDVIV